MGFTHIYVTRLNLMYLHVFYGSSTTYLQPKEGVQLSGYNSELIY